jgi:hypothetical protein
MRLKIILHHPASFPQISIRRGQKLWAENFGENKWSTPGKTLRTFQLNKGPLPGIRKHKKHENCPEIRL